MLVSVVSSSSGITKSKRIIYSASGIGNKSIWPSLLESTPLGLKYIGAPCCGDCVNSSCCTKYLVGLYCKKISSVSLCAAITLNLFPASPKL